MALDRRNSVPDPFRDEHLRQQQSAIVDRLVGNGREKRKQQVFTIDALSLILSAIEVGAACGGRGLPRRRQI